jgi:hypothetical protein
VASGVEGDPEGGAGLVRERAPDRPQARSVWPAGVVIIDRDPVAAFDAVLGPKPLIMMG